MSRARSLAEEILDLLISGIVLLASNRRPCVPFMSYSGLVDNASPKVTQASNVGISNLFARGFSLKPQTPICFTRNRA